MSPAECLSHAFGNDLEASAGRNAPQFAVDGPWYILEGSGTVVTAKCYERSSAKAPRHGGGIRGSVSEFSRGSSKRFTFTLNEINWDAIEPERCFSLRFTDPRPLNHHGRGEKECLEQLRRSIDRYFGADGYWAVWKREYGHDRKPHLHIILVVLDLPKRVAHSYGVSRESLPPAEFERDFFARLSRVWCRVIGVPDNGDTSNLVYCERVRNIRGAVNYISKGQFGSAKAYESRTPDGVVPDGRWWGIWRRKLVPSGGKHLVLGRKEFFRARRILRQVPARRRHGRVNLGIWSAKSPMTIVSNGSDLQIFNQVCRYIEGLRSEEHGGDQLSTGTEGDGSGTRPNDRLRISGDSWPVLEHGFGARVMTTQGE